MIKKNKPENCICGTPVCSGSCVTNCQCSFQELNLSNKFTVNKNTKNNGQYICSMRCEGEKTYPAPGDCPVCGMHLEKLLTFGTEQKKEDNDDFKNYKKMFYKFIIALAFAIPVLILAMSELIPFINIFIKNLIPEKISLIIQFALSFPVVIFAAGFLFLKGITSIIKWKLNMFTLITIGTGVAWIYSIIVIFFPDIFPVSFKNQHGNVVVYFETACAVLTFVILGQMLELKAHLKTNNAIKELLNLVPSKAIVIRDGKEIEVLLQDIVVNDKIRIKPGEKISIDGKIIEGNGVLDESMITGEPLPVEKEAGAKVTGGTINTNGSFIFTAEKVGKDTLLAKIIDMVNQASRSKAPIQKLTDTVSKYFVQAVVI